MANDETRPLPADGAAPARADGIAGDGVNPAQAPPAAQPWAGWPDVEPDPWVDVTPPRPGEAPVFEAPGSRPSGEGRRRVLGVVGLVAAGAVAGALIVSAVNGFSGSNTATVQPGGVAQNGTAPNGVAPNGAQDGEQRLTGTLTAISGSKVTVRTASGSGTYQLVSQTQIVRNGALVSASDLKAGDRVLMHVFPADGSDGVLERLIAVSGSGTGTSGTGGAGDDDAADT